MIKWFHSAVEAIQLLTELWKDVDKDELFFVSLGSRWLDYSGDLWLHSIVCPFRESSVRHLISKYVTRYLELFNQYYLTWQRVNCESPLDPLEWKLGSKIYSTCKLQIPSSRGYWQSATSNIHDLKHGPTINSWICIFCSYNWNYLLVWVYSRWVTKIITLAFKNEIQHAFMRGKQTWNLTTSK